MKNKLFYPAVFSNETNGYSVTFPDLPECITQGNSLDNAYEMAVEALGLCLAYREEQNMTIPEASDLNGVQLSKQQFLMLIEFDMLEYKKRTGMKAVKKTLTIPSWLNEEAEKAGINFSSVLQAALKERLEL